MDIATTEALSMAQEVDPDGDRTIGKREPASGGPGGRGSSPMWVSGIGSAARDAHTLHWVRAWCRQEPRGLGVCPCTADGPCPRSSRSGSHAASECASPPPPSLPSSACVDHSGWGMGPALFALSQWPRQEKVAHQPCCSLGNTPRARGAWGRPSEASVDSLLGSRSSSCVRSAASSQW